MNDIYRVAGLRIFKNDKPMVGIHLNHGEKGWYITDPLALTAFDKGTVDGITEALDTVNGKITRFDERSWKEGLIEHCSAIEKTYSDLADHIRAGDDVDADPDELAAFMTIKLVKLGQRAEQIMGG